MKSLKSILLSVAILSLLSVNLTAADWVIHAAPGTNPFIGFSRVSTDGATIESIQAMYGVDPTFSYATDAWSIVYLPYEGAYHHFVTGTVFTVDDSWITQAIPYSPDYGSISVQFWAIEGLPPDWIGWSDRDMGDTTVGEYWVDWASDGTIRITNSAPADFGKWLGDGSINPLYVEPMPLAPPKKGKAKGHNK